MALRLPGGVHSPSDFWEMLVNKRDGRCAVPLSRYNVDGFADPTEPHSVKPRHGYFLNEDPALFDASFFSISALDAQRMDPQQRLLLEVAWECLESSGESDWRGKPIGCYVGVFGGDWLELECKDTEGVDRYRAVGTGDFALSNRISYEFDLRGPSMTVETGCSASLVGLHEACQALQLGTCSSALVAGTNLIFGPSMTITMSQNGVLSPEGICRTFDKSADGYGRGEAVNAVYIKPLQAAIRDGNLIRAVIRATGTNFDGRTSNITSPCPDSQEALIRSTYARARIDKIQQTALFECHGTATVAGDTVEASVVAKVFAGYGTWIGAVKPNVGHSEGASGLTSLIKAVLALERRTIPPNIHFESPNPDVPFEEGKLKVPLEVTPWPEDRSERVSVNSFGIGGSNVHVIIDSAAQFAPTLQRRDALGAEEEPKVLFMSAQAEDVLQKRIAQLVDFANRRNDGSLQDLAYTLAVRSSQLSYRAFAVIDPSSPIDTSRFHAFHALKNPDLTFIFTGHGAAWGELGHGLMREFPDFRCDILEMDSMLKSIDQGGRPWSLADTLSSKDLDPSTNQAQFAQILATALQIGLFNLLSKRFGLAPSSVVGHSSGEIAAAYAAGAISMRAAILIAYLKGQAVSSLEGSGTMAAIGLGSAIVAPYLTHSVVVACENSPKSVTVAGDGQAIDDIIQRIREDHSDVLCRRLPVSIPYHSPSMKQVGAYLESLIEPHIEYQHGGRMIPMFSSVHAKVICEPVQLNAQYWRQNLESPVLFSSAIQALFNEAGTQNHVFYEVGPRPVLGGPCQQIAKSMAKQVPKVVYIAIDRSTGSSSTAQLLESVATAHCNGVSSDLHRVTGPGVAVTDLPPYPWNHETRHWLDNRMVTDWRMRSAPRHELLGGRVADSSDLEPSWRNLFYRQEVDWLEEHVLAGEVIFPGACYIAMAGEAVQQMHPDAKGYSIRKLVFRAALILKERHRVEMITSFRPVRLNDLTNSDWYAFTITTYDGTTWTTHCHGEVCPGVDSPAQSRTSAVPKAYRRRVDPERWYGVLRNRGLDYGMHFRGLKDITTDPTERICTAGVTDPDDPQSRYALHPVVIDQCLQAMSVACANGIGRRLMGMGIPVAIESLYVKESTETMTVDVSVVQTGQGKQVGEATLLSPEGDILLAARQALFLSVDDQIRLSGSSIPVASQMRWAPDIEFLSRSSLIRMVIMDDSARKMLKDCVLGTQLAICMTEERLQDVEPTVPHLVKWKDWVVKQAACIRGRGGLYPEEMLQFQDMTRDQQEAHVRSISDHYLADAQWKPAAEAIRSVCDNCTALATGETTAIDVLMAGDHLKGYYEATQEMFDWSHFLPALGHSNPRLRVLEIGAGTGGATSAVLRSLRTPEGARLYSRYVFTDISPGFTGAARERFPDAGLEFQVLDITKDVEGQGFEPHTYDLVIAGNVLHATPSLRDTLSQVRKLLAPQGWLLLQELTTPGLIMTDYIMGTLAGWWIGADDGRPDHPYTTPERWDVELRAAGFSGNESIAYDTEVPLRSAFTMLSRMAPDANSLEDSGRTECAMAQGTKVKRGLAILINNELGAWALDVTEKLRSAGHDVQFIRWEDTPKQDQWIISLVDLDGPFLCEMGERGFRTVQEFLQRLNEQPVFWITHTTTSTPQGTCEIDPRYSLVLGFAAAMRLETRRRFINVQVDEFNTTAARAVHQVVGQVIDQALHRPDLDEEYHFAIEQGTVYTSRCHWIPTTKLLPDNQRASAACKLEVGAYGLVDTLQWVQAREQTLGADDVEIDVHYVGLNFRDLMVAMGVVGDARELGLEGSGVVRRVGNQVTDLTPGDEVIVVTSGILRSKVVVEQRRCIKLSQLGAQVSLEGAATMPTVYATALWVFAHLAKLRKGQTVLIHSACGGVGLASIRVCQELGAKIFATVGNEEKAKYLTENMGIPRDCIFKSHDSSFLPDIMRETSGRGVDVVLNSLAGKLLHASWECVAPYGQFFEIGKRDLLTHGTLDMGPFLHNRTFYGVDLLHLQNADSGRFQGLLQEFEDWNRGGKIAPIRPTKVFDAVDVVDAFRYLQTGAHIGKIVLKIPGSAVTSCLEAREIHVELKSDDVYLLIGGLGGLGRAITTWMWERGARNFIFLSRTAGVSDGDKAFLAELQGLGCTVSAVAGSVTDSTDVERALSQCAGRRLAGVIQLSMLLRDQTFLDMTFAEWSAALAPKMQGTWNLHKALQHMQLDFLVLSGSNVSLTGNFGQANYAAANSFLEAFAGYRRRQGLSCSVMHLGPVEDIGMVSESPNILQFAREHCVRLLGEREVMEALALAIRQSPVCEGHPHSPHSSIMGLGYSKPTADPKVVVMWEKDARFGIYYGMETQGESRAVAYKDHFKALVERVEADHTLLDEPGFDRELTHELGNLMTKYMPSAANMDEEQVVNMKVDSLMAIEIKSAIRRSARIDLTLGEINKAGTVRGLAQLAITHMKAKYADRKAVVEAAKPE
ncbi:putative polyketide synthase [Aspergillus californicus]